MVEHGFEDYRATCVVCHGAPGVERGEFGKGITPTPPDLSEEEAAEWSAKELFWISEHGIELAGMPAFGPTHSDEEIRLPATPQRLLRLLLGAPARARHARTFPLTRPSCDS